MLLTNQHTNKFFEAKLFPLFYLPIAFVFLLLFSKTTSPLFEYEGSDSAVFKTMGLAVLQGKILYADIFDNKGPILYFINALGQWLIPGRIGIFLLQIISLSLTLWLLYKTARLFSNGLYSFLSTLLSLFLLMVFFMEGNQCEEWMLPYLAFAFYYSIKNLLSIYKKIDAPSRLSTLLLGISFGITFFIRPNDAVAIFGGIMLGMTLFLLFDTKVKTTLITIFLFLVGTLIATLPIVVYFAHHNAIEEFWYGIYGVNVYYTGGLKHKLLNFDTAYNLALIPVVVALCVMLCHSGAKKTLFVIILASVFELILIGDASYWHYYIVLIPMFNLFFTMLFAIHSTPLVIMAVAIVTFTPQTSAFIILPKQDMKIIKDYRKLNSQEKCKAIYQQSEILLKNIPLEERNNIWNYNLSHGSNYEIVYSLFAHNRITHCNKTTFDLHRGRENKVFNDHLLEQPTLPPYVLLSRDCCDNIEQDSIFISNYHLIAESDSSVCRLALYQKNL